MTVNMHRKRKVVFSTRFALLLGLAFCFSACRNSPSSQVQYFDPQVSESGFLPRANPEAVGVDAAALSSLVAEAQASHSHALIVIKDGRVVGSAISTLHRAAAPPILLLKALSL